MYKHLVLYADTFNPRIVMLVEKKALSVPAKGHFHVLFSNTSVRQEMFDRGVSNCFLVWATSCFCDFPLLLPAVAVLLPPLSYRAMAKSAAWGSVLTGWSSLSQHDFANRTLQADRDALQNSLLSFGVLRLKGPDGARGLRNTTTIMSMLNEHGVISPSLPPFLPLFPPPFLPSYLPSFI
jgi:hypothetical protein